MIKIIAAHKSLELPTQRLQEETVLADCYWCSQNFLLQSFVFRIKSI